MTPSESSDNDSRKSNTGAGGERSDIQQAIDRLEKSVHDLVVSAKDEFSGKAASLLNETATKLERELSPESIRQRVRALDEYVDLTRQSHTRQLFRDPRRAKIAGVCAGFARYFGIETWVARCIAVTGMVFMPTITFPAYWIAYFLMDKTPNSDARRNRVRRRSRRDHSSPAPELGPRFSPRRSLRNVTAELTEVELRLRRMEGHVTSDQYELGRELNKIDPQNDSSGQIEPRSTGQ